MPALTSRNIDTKLRAWRVKHGDEDGDMTRITAAKKLGISVRTLEHLENGRPTTHWRTMLIVVGLHNTCEDLKHKISQMGGNL